MTTTTVTLNKIDCKGNDCIEASINVVKSKTSHIVQFGNALDPKVDANIQFYEANTKKTKAALKGFCKEESGDTLVVPKGTKKNCTLAEGAGIFEYTVKADGYITLDPIIIIEPQKLEAKKIVEPATLIITVVVVALASFAGFWLGARKK